MLKAADKNFARSFDLLIIDYNTPENNAFEFVRKLKQDVLINKLPKMILVVPMEREDLLTEIEGSDFEIAVTRPIIPSVLLNSILELFKFKAVMSSERNINEFKSTSDNEKKK
jgi:CheY-like chemotaxis protein